MQIKVEPTCAMNYLDKIGLALLIQHNVKAKDLKAGGPLDVVGEARPVVVFEHRVR